MIAKISDIEFIHSNTHDALILFNDDLKQKLINLLISKRNDKKQQEEFEYEIMVGSLLKMAGFNIVHEKKVDTKTPDWFIYGNENHADFILEVGVLNSEQIVTELDKQISELKKQIRKLPFNYELAMDYSHFIEPEYVTAFVNINGIIDDLTSWLNNNSNGSIDTNDVSFEIIGVTKNGISLNTDTKFGRVWRDDRFVAKLEEKRDAYLCELVKYKYPYVVAIISTFNSGTTIERIFDILTGRNKTTATLSIIGNSIPTISGILVVEPLSKWKVEYFDNSESALFELDKNIFDNLIESINSINHKEPDFALSREEYERYGVEG